MPSAEYLVEVVEEALKLSRTNESRFPKDSIKRNVSGPTTWQDVESMDHPEYLHMLNNLTFEGAVVCHVGFWQGMSLFANLYDTQPSKVYALDYFFRNPDLKEKFLNNSVRLGFDGRYELFDKDFRSVEVSSFSPIDLHIYDADHSPEGQYWGIKHFYSAFADRFILVVDNWGLPDVAASSERAIEDCGLVVIKKEVVDRHQRQGVFVLEKPSV